MVIRKIFTLLLILTCFNNSMRAQVKSENIVLITLDGLRWQEVFGGADSLLTFDTAADYASDFVKEHFWASTSTERRKKLMPFFWSEIASKGVLLGNRAYGNYVNNANPYWFSYPGYNEIFTGYPDTTVNSNNKNLNKNENVFEFLHKLPEFKNKTIAFSSWDVISYILNEPRAGFAVIDGFKNVPGKLTANQQFYNDLQHQLPLLFQGGERLDVATFYMALEYMKVNKPKLIYFGFGDTDEFAHAGKYDYYLDAAQKTDEWIRQIWNYIQSTPGYANKTTMIITTDHGRGPAVGGGWKHHGTRTAGSDQMWMAMIGPSVKPIGESKQQAQVYQGQIATSIAAYLGKEFKPSHPVLPVLIVNK